MDYRIRKMGGRWMIVDRSHDLGGTDYRRVAGLSPQDAADLVLGGMPFVTAPAPGELPEGQARDLAVMEIVSGVAGEALTWHLALGETALGAIDLGDARGLVSEGWAVLRPAAAPVRAAALRVRLARLEERRAALDGQIAGIAAELADLEKAGA